MTNINRALQEICTKALGLPLSDWRIIKGQPQLIGRGYLYVDETNKYQQRTLISASVDGGRLLVIRNDRWLGDTEKDKAEFLPLYYDVLYCTTAGEKIKVSPDEDDSPLFGSLFDKIVYKK
jgi:hypothetical protein